MRGSRLVVPVGIEESNFADDQLHRRNKPLYALEEAVITSVRRAAYSYINNILRAVGGK